MSENFLLDEIMSDSYSTVEELSLPTNGAFYDPADQVLVEGANPAAVRIVPLTSLKENTFQDPIMMLSGKATEKLVRQVCPDIQNPMKLCDIDMEAILLAARLVSYGSDMKVPHKCQNPELKTPEELAPIPKDEQVGDMLFKCREESIVPVDLSAMIQKYAPFTDEVYETFKLVLPNGQVVMLKPITYGDALRVMRDLMRENATTFKADELFTENMITEYVTRFERNEGIMLNTIMDQINFVQSRSGHRTSDMAIIQPWLETLPDNVLLKVQEKIKEMNDGFARLSVIQYTCPVCSYENEFRVDFDPQKLFTVAEPSSPEKGSSAKSPSIGSAGSKSSKTTPRSRSPVRGR